MTMFRRVVWKYPVPDGEDSFVLSLPTVCRFVALDVIENEPFVWFEVDPNSGRQDVRFFARDTGQPLEVGLRADGYDPTLLGTYKTFLSTLGIWNVRHVWMDA